MNTYNYDEIFKDIESRHGLEVLDLIQNLPLEKQRIAMLAAICYKKDSNLVKIINELKSSSRIAYLDSLIERIRKYNGIGDIEKKSFGEVFTPFSLIEEMLDTLPVEVWTNPNLKWGDFCNGIGNFMVIVIKRLMIGLKEWENDDDLRYKHIVENMIYVGELQEKNMFLWMVSIDPRSEFKLNMFRGDALSEEFDEHRKNVWGVEKWDVLVSNPPYQLQKEGFKKTQPLWHTFVQRYLNDLLVDNGYMTMVHPSGWRNVDGIFKNTQLDILERELTTLVMRNTSVGFETFGANIDFDYYTVKNTKFINNFTNIIDYNNNTYNICLTGVPFIPNCNINHVLSLVAKENEKRVDVLFSRSEYGNDKPHMSKIKDDEFKYPCAYTVGSLNPRFLYSNIKKGHFDIPKVVWGNGLTDVIVDSFGDYGLTNFTYAIIDDVDNLPNIKNALKSEKFIKDVMGYTKGVGHIYNWKVIATFRKDFWKDFI